MNSSADTQQKLAQQFAQARQEWEAAGLQKPDFEADRDAFYKSLQQKLLPPFIKAGGSEQEFLFALQQYAREDWGKSGRSVAEFDAKLDGAKAKKLSAKQSAVTAVVAYCLLQIIFSLFGIRVGFVWHFLLLLLVTAVAQVGFQLIQSFVLDRQPSSSAPLNLK